MVIRQRAMQAHDKQERHDAILDAAERLLLRSPDRVASVAEVAGEADLAKGTVYLYFPGKEELLLAVHERNVDGFFRPLIAILEGTKAVAFDDVFAVTRERIVTPPLFLPLASRCFGLMAPSIPPDIAAAFMQRMATRLERAGAGLERHFPQLKPGDGVALLRYSYALIIGLWQMSSAHGGNAHCPLAGAPAGASGPARVFGSLYPDDLSDALRALWRGFIGSEVPAKKR